MSPIQPSVIPKNASKRKSLSNSFNDSYISSSSTKKAIAKRSLSRTHSVLNGSNSIRSLTSSWNSFPCKSSNINNKYVAMKKQRDEVNQKLIRQRQKTHKLKTKLEKYEREYNMKKSVYDELKELKLEYDQLKSSFDKSEKLRKHQKEIIKELKENLNKIKDTELKIKKKKTKKIGRASWRERGYDLVKNRRTSQH